MNIETELINMHAMCRECAKKFSSSSKRRSVYQKIQQHMKESPGHVVIGTEQTRMIFKEQGEPCIAR